MKRIFTNLKAYASVAMAIAVMGVAALGVSCKYDDTAIYDEIEGVKGDLDGVKEDLATLEARVAALETKLNNEVAGLQALIVTAKTEILDEVDGKIVAVNGSVEDLAEALAAKYAELAAKDATLAAQLTALETAVGQVISASQKSTGEWVLTLSDGKEITIYPQTKQEYHGVTAMQQNGVYYWAQYNADGTTTFLKDEEGNKYPLHQATPVVDVEGAANSAVNAAMGNIKVEPNADGELQLTLDGGKTWYPLGGGGDAGLFTGVSQDVAAGTATFTLVGGEEITVTLAQEAEPEMVFGIKSGKVHFDNEETKAIRLTAELVEEVVVISAPRGWVVEYNGKDLEVTAPSYEDVVDTETADESGWIKVLATGKDNAAHISKLRVTTSEQGLFIEVFGDGTMNIQNTMTYEDYGMEMACPFYYGIVPADKLANLKELVMNYEISFVQEALPSLEEPMDIAYLYTYCNSYFDYDTYEYVEPEMELGGNYVIWATPHSMVTYEPDFDELVWVDYKNVVVSAEVTASYLNDVDVNIVVEGYDYYCVNIYQTQYADSVADDLAQAVMYADWWGFNFGYMFYDNGFEGSLSEMVEGQQEFHPGTAYTAFILPMSNDTDLSTLTVDNLVRVDFNTIALTAGGEGTPSFVLNEEKTGFTEIFGTITPVENSALTYYKWYTAEELAAFENDEALIADLTNLADYMSTTYITVEETEARIQNLGQGQTVTLVALSVDAEGKYGQLLKTNATTKQVTFSEVTLTAGETEFSADRSVYNVKITASGEVAKYRYDWVDTSDYRWYGTSQYNKDVANAETYMVTSAEGDYYVKDAVVNEYGFLTLPLPKFDTEYKLIIGAIDAAGNPTHVIALDVDSTFSATVISQYLEDGVTVNPVWEASKPTVEVSSVYDAQFKNYAVTISVTPGAGAVKCWMGKMSLYGTQLATAKVKNMLSNWMNNKRKALGAEESDTVSGVYCVGAFTSETDVMEYTAGNYDHIHITWMDAEGNFYEPYCYFAKGVAEAQ